MSEQDGTGRSHEGSAAPAGGEAICPRCDGSGRADGQECPTCGGTGKVIEPAGGA